MTDDHKTVTGDFLERIVHLFADLITRVTATTKPLDPERTIHILQIAADGTPQARYGANSQVDYVLECGWAWDNGHTEFFTISVEECDRDYLCFDRLLDATLPQKQKREAMEVLLRMFRGIYTGAGSPHMNRLYEITSQEFYGYSPGSGLKGTVTSGMVDMHMVLKPICEFDDNNNPIPCEIR